MIDRLRSGYFATALVASLGQATTQAVATHANVEFEEAQTDNMGTRIVYRRTHADTTAPCNDPAWTEILLMDLRRACGQDIVREVTSNGESLDPTISRDGQYVAWRTKPMSGAAEHRFYRMSTAGGAPALVLGPDTSPQVGQLELSPDGAWLVYWRQTATGEEIRRVNASTGVSTLVDGGAGMVVRLNDAHPVSTAGTVYYTRADGASRDLYCQAPGQLPVRLLDATGSSWIANVAVSADGLRQAFIHYVDATPFGFVGDVWFRHGEGELLRITSSVVTYDFVALDISSDGSRVAFIASGPWAGNNPDESLEVFRSGTGPVNLEQITNFVGGIPSQSRSYDRVSLDDEGDVIAYAERSALVFPCESNWTLQYSVPDAPTSFTPLDNEGIPEPPFDVITDTSTDPLGDLSPEAGCTNVVGSTTCLVYVRNSNEGARNVVLAGEWHASGGACPIRDVYAIPVPLTLTNDKIIAVSSTLSSTCSSAEDGTFALTVVGADVVQADRATGSVTF